MAGETHPIFRIGGCQAMGTAAEFRTLLVSDGAHTCRPSGPPPSVTGCCMLTRSDPMYIGRVYWPDGVLPRCQELTHKAWAVLWVSAARPNCWAL